MRSTRALFLVPFVLAACGGDAPPAAGDTSGGPQVARTMDGDTAVVRTVSGSVWGDGARLVPEVEIGVLDGDPNYMFGSIRSLAVDAEGRIFVMDAQALEVRVFAPDGTWIANWGRDGEGPGEFAQPDGGMVVLSDGRLVVRDPGNARFQVYSPEGQPAGQWSVIRGGFSTSTQFALHGDTILTSQVLNLDDGVPVRDWRTGYVRVSPEGEILDSIPFPTADFQEAVIEASLDGNTSVNRVPWSAQEELAWHPDGYFVHGTSDAYSFTLLREGAPLRIERAYTPVRVGSGERAMQEALTTRNMRGTDPNWRWNGPAIPDVKPPFADLNVGRDGRIWVSRTGEAYEREDPNYDPSEPEAVERNWGEERMFDVFESDGTFLGTVAMPRDLSPYPQPLFDGDRVWATATDDLGVQRVVRYRIERGGGGDAGD